MLKVMNFLTKQKARMLKLDEMQGLRKREENGRDWSKKMPDGRVIGLREQLYSNVISWISDQRYSLLREDFLTLSMPGVLSEDVTTTNVPTLTTNLLPAVRRVYATLIGMDLVSVQPLNGPSGKIYFQDFEFGTTGGGATSGQRVDQYRYNDYADSEEEGTIREIDFRISSKTVNTSIKKLKSLWTLEAEQNVQADIGLNLEAELTSQIADEIRREIDGEIISALAAGVGIALTWNTTGWLDNDKSTFERMWYKRSLYEKLLEADSEIRKNKKRGADWILCDSDVYEYLEKLEQFTASSVNNGEATLGSLHNGVIANKWKVYVDDDYTANSILMGMRGSWLESVGYYAPWIPLYMSERYMRNDDFSQLGKGAMSRYALGVIPETSGGSTNNGLAEITLTSS